MIRIPFEIDDIHGGFSEAHGVIFVDDEFVVLEMRTITMGMIKHDPQTIKIEPTALDHVDTKRGFFSDRLLIVPKKVALFDAIPGTHKHEIKLKVAKRYRADLEKLIFQIESRILDVRA